MTRGKRVWLGVEVLTCARLPGGILSIHFCGKLLFRAVNKGRVYLSNNSVGYH